MNAKTLSVFAGLTGTALLAGTANAAFTGVEAEAKMSDFGNFVCNVYATFDNPNDVLVAVAGTPNTPMNISVVGGTFYQNDFGGDNAYNPNSRRCLPVDRRRLVRHHRQEDRRRATPPASPRAGAASAPAR